MELHARRRFACAKAPLIFNNYSPKAKLTILTEPEVNNCFSIYTRIEVISTESETRKPWKKRLVWLTGEFMREHVPVNSRRTNVDLYSICQHGKHSFNFFVSVSINDWKENVESWNNSPFWEETQSFICFCQLTVNETVFLSLLANAVNSGYDRGERCLSVVQCLITLSGNHH